MKLQINQKFKDREGNTLKITCFELLNGEEYIKYFQPYKGNVWISKKQFLEKIGMD